MIRRLAILLLCAPALLAAPSASASRFPELPHHPQDFLEDALVDGASGWARTYRGVYWTDDGGASWRNITPPVAHPIALQAVSFADTEHGFALAEESGEAHPRPVLFSTADGGHSWTRTPIHIGSFYSQARDASFAMVGAHQDFALVRESRNTAFSIGYLFESRGGGRHWHEVPGRVPGAGQIAFTNARLGWLAVEGPHQALYRTRDGGRRWQDVRLARPAGLARAMADYLPPRFEADGHGVLAATYEGYERPSVTVLYASEDFGRHWTRAAQARLPAEGYAPFAYRGSEAVAAPIYETPEIGLLGLDGGATPLAGSGLPAEISPSLSFSDPEDGFGLIEAEDCTRKLERSQCTEINGLYFTADGGESWAPTARP